MKKVIFLFLAFVSLSLTAQNTDSAAYRSYYVKALIGDSVYSSDSDELFYFSGNKVTTTIKEYQLKTLYFLSVPKRDLLTTGNEVLTIPCKDAGGFQCYLYIGRDTTVDAYFISIVYANLILYFEAKVTSERPWDDDPVDLIPFEVPKEMNYTKKQVDDFIKTPIGKLMINAFLDDENSMNY
jgi:hypothetical protein